MNVKNWCRFGLAGLLLSVGGLWILSPSEAELMAEGRELFVHEWTPNDPLSGAGDGLGPVFNEKSCVACHFQGGAGGGGAVEQNVSAFLLLPNRNDPDLKGGVIHAFATAETFQETQQLIRSEHPAIPDSTRIVGGCTVRTQGFDPLLIEHINTPALYGVGLIDGISASALKSARRGRELQRLTAEFHLKFDQTAAGRLRSHGFGAVGKFGWRGQFATLEDFVATACAVELGLTNPVRAQDVPREHRPDENAEYDMDSRQLKALVTYCRNLPRPEQVLPADTKALKRVRRGEQAFLSVGCADCHTPDVGGIEGVYSDFLLYSLERDVGGTGYTEELEVPMPAHLPEPDEWQTPPLWGVADSAPYFHDGQSATLAQAVQRHEGDAKYVMKRHKKLSTADKQNLIEFLKTLRAPTTAEKLPQPELTTTTQ